MLTPPSEKMSRYLQQIPVLYRQLILMKRWIKINIQTRHKQISVVDPDRYDFLGLLDPDPLVRLTEKPWFVPYCFVGNFFTKNYENVASKSNKQKNFRFFCVLKVKDNNIRIWIRIRIRIHWSEARIRIRTKLSRIHNTEKNINKTSAYKKNMCRTASYA